MMLTMSFMKSDLIEHYNSVIGYILNQDIPIHDINKSISTNFSILIFLFCSSIHIYNLFK